MPFGIASSGGFAPVAIGEAVSMLILAGVFIRRFPESVKGRWWIAPKPLARLWSAARSDARQQCIGIIRYHTRHWIIAQCAGGVASNGASMFAMISACRPETGENR